MDQVYDEVLKDFNVDHENPVVVYYYSLASMLTRRYEHCHAAMLLTRALIMPIRSRGSSYLNTKLTALQKLVKRLEREEKDKFHGVALSAR